jgi:hypothetical protein
MRRRTRAGLIGALPVLAAVAGVALIGGWGRSEPDPNPPTPPGRAHSTRESAAPTPMGSAPSTQKRVPVRTIRLTVAGRTIDIPLNDSTTASDLVQQLPLTLRFRDFGAQEKTAKLPADLSLEGVPSGSDAKAGDVGYYAPDSVLVLFYKDVGYFSGIVRLGRMAPSDMEFIRDQPDGFQASIAVAD